MTCKANEAVALNTEATKEFVDANGVVMIKADKAYAQEAIDMLLEKLGNPSGAIPFYAIFPAGYPNKPILFDGLLTQTGFLERLEQAGPSSNMASSGKDADNVVFSFGETNW